MSPSDSRFARQELLFGADGQRQISDTRVAIAGVGGTGSHVAQQLAFIGVRSFLLIDPDRVEKTNLNRLVGACEQDAIAGRLKVDVSKRQIRMIEHGVRVTTDTAPVDEDETHLAEVDVLFCCVDSDRARLEVLSASARAGVPFFDLATDTGGDGNSGWFGGRVLFSGLGERCAYCMDLIDQRAIRHEAQTEGQRAEEEAIYGVSVGALANGGPSVVSVNGVIASLAVTEFMKFRTGLGSQANLLVYRGEAGVVRVSADQPMDGCYYCGLWGISRSGKSEVVRRST
jgi:molybdopterin-synthase adenylyltransferase